MQATLNIHRFFTICTHLVFEASKIIKQVHQSSNLNINLKQKQGVFNDPVTEADYKVQSLIFKGIRKYWPDIIIVGEEQKDYDKIIEYDFSKLENPIFEEGLFSKGKNGEDLEPTLQLSKVIVWVDPLDGTLSYTQGYLNQVTTLIGLSYQGKTRLGIVGLPFQKQDTQNQAYSFNPKVYVADSLNSKCCRVDTQFKIQSINPRKHNENHIRLCTTRNNLHPEIMKTLQSITKDIARMGGMGKKALEIIENKSDTLVYLGRGISNWDVSAPQALILSVNGGISKSDGTPYRYEIGEKYLIPQGSIICVDKELHAQVVAKVTNSKI